MDKLMEKFYDDFPTEPIGGGNPYHRCKYCKLSVPEINYRLNGHRKNCEYLKIKSNEAIKEDTISFIELIIPKLNEDESDIAYELLGKLKNLKLEKLESEWY